ncbi:hypothetical protein V3C99_011002 [Haemonchus contortus]|uniref:Transposase n=1 Tax=Haemonchus contortus TaxID=6289 RepID=A0A7I5E852_HAECO
MIGISLYTQVQKGIRSSELRHRTKIRDAVDYVKKSKWAGHVMRYSGDRWTRAVTDWIPRDIKRTPGRPPTRCGPHWLVTEMNGAVTGARPRKSMIKGTTGDK